jgi:hypothetical protein
MSVNSRIESDNIRLTIFRRAILYFLLVCLFCLAVFCTLAALPFWRFYLIGAPAPGTAPRYVGEVSIVGDMIRTRYGWRPRKYFIQTLEGPKELRCGFWPSYTSCPIVYRSRVGEIYEIGYDPYWGVDYIKYPKVRGEVYIWTGAEVDESRSRQARGHFYYQLISIGLMLFGFFVFKRLKSAGR